MYRAPRIDFEEYHRERLPRRLSAGACALARPALEDAPPIAMRVEGRAFTYVPSPGGVDIVPGEDKADTVVEFDAAGWSDMVQQFQTVTGLAVQGRANVARGDLGVMLRWEPALYALYWGVPVYDPRAADLTDARGRPLDLSRSFTLADPPAEIAEFLDKAGFLHLRGVFSADEIAAMRAEIGRQTSAARPGDGRSWWGRTRDGRKVVTRLTYAGVASPEIAALAEDARVRRVVEISGLSLAPVIDREEGQVVILKTAEVIDGVADYPWHQDFSMGGRPYMCPGLLIGIQLTASNEDAGPFIVVPGTQRTVCRAVLPDDEAERLPQIVVRTQPGDCTAHFTDTLHAAPPPRVGGRETLYVNFAPPFLHDNLAPGESHNDFIQRNLSQV